MMRLIADAAPQKGEIAMRSGQAPEVRCLLPLPLLSSHIGVVSAAAHIRPASLLAPGDKGLHLATRLCNTHYKLLCTSRSACNMS